MNPSIPSHTPRVKPLNYDALRNSIGCQSITGTDHRSLMAFDRVCVADTIFDSIEDEFRKPRTIAHALGPDELGVPETGKFSIPWTAWVSTKGVRVAKVADVTLPANNVGMQSSLFPTTKPVHLSLGFNSLAMMAIAVEVSGVITFKRFTNLEGNVQTNTWNGISPQVFSTWQLYHGDEVGGDNLVVFYFDPVRRNVLCARFEHENFEWEQVINPDLPVDIDYIVTTYAKDFGQTMLARATGGESVTLTSPQYAVQTSDKATIASSITSGAYALSAVESELVTEDKATFSARIVGGAVSELKVGSTVTEDKATISASISAGTYE